MKELIYDGSYEGFLTAVFEAFASKESELTIRSESSCGFDMFEQIVVTADRTKAFRVGTGIERLSRELLGTLYAAWLSEELGIEDAVLATLRLGFSLERDPMPMKYEPCVRRVELTARKVGYEIHRAKQFIRFINMGGLYAADYEPQYNILHAIGEHFHERFASQRFIIRDLKRKLAVVSDEQSWWIRVLSDEEASVELKKQDEFTEMWKGYFKILANPQRKNPKLQQQFIPLRYRKHLTEFHQ